MIFLAANIFTLRVCSVFIRCGLVSAQSPAKHDFYTK